MNSIRKIAKYQESAYAALFVLTHEERRFMNELCWIRTINSDLSIYEWDVQIGLKYVTGPKQLNSEGAEVPTVSAKEYEEMQHNAELTSNITKIILYLQTYDVSNCIFVMKDFHMHFDNKLVIRHLRNAWNVLKSRGNMLIFTGHKFAVPGELQKEIQLLDYSLPDAEAHKERLKFVDMSIRNTIQIQNEQTGGDRKAPELSEAFEDLVAEAAKGMTSTEAENAIALAWAENKAYNEAFVQTVFQEKIAQLKKNGLLSYMEPNVSFDNVGGLGGLKTWLMSRKKAYAKEARAYNLPLPKGMLLASVPGTGKSLICKAIAKEFDCPLFALDIGSIFDSLVGNSEKNMREVIKTVESVGKCVILIDEIEKSLSNSAVSGAGDSGVSSRIFGTFLTWLNDRTNPAFIVATTNNHTLLPPALIRKGRFDQLFWVDLPTADERKEIFSVVIKKYGRDPRNFAINTFVTGSKQFTGAEIEEVFKDAMYKAFDLGEEVNDSHITEGLAEFIPFAKSHKEDLETMRQQAQGKLMMVTSKGDPIADVQKNMRKLSIAIGEE